MIPPQDILGYLRAAPFRPFQIRMAGGRTFDDIRHPEMVRVGRNSMIVFTLLSDQPEVYDRWETASLVRIEPSPTSKPSRLESRPGTRMGTQKTYAFVKA